MHQIDIIILATDLLSTHDLDYAQQVICMLPVLSLFHTSLFWGRWISQHSTLSVKLSVRYRSLMRASVQPWLVGKTSSDEPDTHTWLPPETKTHLHYTSKITNGLHRMWTKDRMQTCTVREWDALHKINIQILRK